MIIIYDTLVSLMNNLYAVMSHAYILTSSRKLLLRTSIRDQFNEPF